MKGFDFAGRITYKEPRQNWQKRRYDHEKSFQKILNVVCGCSPSRRYRIGCRIRTLQSPQVEKNDGCILCGLLSGWRLYAKRQLRGERSMPERRLLHRDSLLSGWVRLQRIALHRAPYRHLVRPSLRKRTRVPLLT